MTYHDTSLQPKMKREREKMPQKSNFSFLARENDVFEFNFFCNSYLLLNFTL